MPQREFAAGDVPRTCSKKHVWRCGGLLRPCSDPGVMWANQRRLKSPSRFSIAAPNLAGRPASDGDNTSTCDHPPSAGSRPLLSPHITSHARPQPIVSRLLLFACRDLPDQALSATGDMQPPEVAAMRHARSQPASSSSSLPQPQPTLPRAHPAGAAIPGTYNSSSSGRASGSSGFAQLSTLAIPAPSTSPASSGTPWYTPIEHSPGKQLPALPNLSQHQPPPPGSAHPDQTARAMLSYSAFYDGQAAEQPAPVIGYEDWVDAYSQQQQPPQTQEHYGAYEYAQPQPQHASQIFQQDRLHDAALQQQQGYYGGAGAPAPQAHHAHHQRDLSLGDFEPPPALAKGRGIPGVTGGQPYPQQQQPPAQQAPQQQQQAQAQAPQPAGANGASYYTFSAYPGATTSPAAYTPSSPPYGANGSYTDASPTYGATSPTYGTTSPPYAGFGAFAASPAKSAGHELPAPRASHTPPPAQRSSPAAAAAPYATPSSDNAGTGDGARRGGERRAKARKKRKTAPAADEEGSDDSGGEERAKAGKADYLSASNRLPGACTHCKKLKMKCDFPPDANVCRRCRQSGHQCVVEGRKPRAAPNKREYLLAQLKQKDAVIESLLKQLHNPYLATPLSIAAFRQAAAPDKQNQTVLAWLERLKAADAAAPQPGAHFLSPGDAARVRSPPSDASSEPGPGSDLSDARSASQSALGGSSLADSDEDSAGPMTEKHLIPDPTVPVGLFANLSLSATRKSTRQRAVQQSLLHPEGVNEDDVGVASETYFMPGPATDMRIRQRLLEQTSPPEILVHGLVTPDDVEKLFEIFFKRINMFFPLLDPVLHTPASTFSRCPFLFTVICAISSRYYPERAEIHPIAMHFARSEAASALVHGWKSVELCQAYILMAIYGTPAKRWEEDRGWLFTGLAIRVAMDLNLHIPPTTGKTQTERQARESLNRSRAWMICFNMDRSTATQFGKPQTIKDEYIDGHSPDFYKSSPYNSPYDIHMCGYNTLLRIVGQVQNELYATRRPNSPSRNADLYAIIQARDNELTRYHEEWAQRFEESKVPNDPVFSMRSWLLPFVVGYSRLVMYSFAFQQAFARGVTASDSAVFAKCLESAKTVVETFTNRLAPSGYMRFSPDGWFLVASFASAFLFKLLRPQFKAFISESQETEILELIGRLIQTLSSPDIAIDDRHTPKVYARFLAGLLSKHRRDGVASFGLQLHPPPGANLGGGQPPAGGMDETSGPAPGSAPQVPGAFPDSRDYGEQPMYDAGAGVEVHNGHARTPSVQVTPAPETETFPDMDQHQHQHPVTTNGNGTYSFHPGDGNTDMYVDDHALASLAALRSPAWWDQMMLPGFTWPVSPPTATHSTLGHVADMNSMNSFPAMATVYQ